MAEFNKRKAEIEKLAAATRDQQEDVEVRRAAIDAKKARSRAKPYTLNPTPYTIDAQEGANPSGPAPSMPKRQDLTLNPKC